jgi:hypothetical protein
VRSDTGEGYAYAVGSMRDDADYDWDMLEMDWDDLYM